MPSQRLQDRARLANLLSLLYWSDLSKGAFAEKIGMQQAYLSLIITGRRRIGTRIAQRIESAFDKEDGWLDIDRSVAARDEHYRILFGRLPREIQESIYVLIQHLSDRYHPGSVSGNGEILLHPQGSIQSRTEHQPDDLDAASVSLANGEGQ